MTIAINKKVSLLTRLIKRLLLLYKQKLYKPKGINKKYYKERVKDTFKPKGLFSNQKAKYNKCSKKNNRNKHKHIRSRRAIFFHFCRF